MSCSLLCKEKEKENQAKPHGTPTSSWAVIVVLRKHLQFAKANQMLEGHLKFTENSQKLNGAYFLMLVPNLTFVGWTVCTLFQCGI